MRRRRHVIAMRNLFSAIQRSQTPVKPMDFLMAKDNLIDYEAKDQQDPTELMTELFAAMHIVPPGLEKDAYAKVFFETFATKTSRRLVCHNLQCPSRQEQPGEIAEDLFLNPEIRGDTQLPELLERLTVEELSDGRCPTCKKVTARTREQCREKFPIILIVSITGTAYRFPDSKTTNGHAEEELVPPPPAAKLSHKVTFPLEYGGHLKITNAKSRLHVEDSLKKHSYNLYAVAVSRLS